MKMSEIKARIRLLKFMGFERTFADSYFKEVNVEGTTGHCLIRWENLTDEHIQDFGEFVRIRCMQVAAEVADAVMQEAFLHGGGFDD